MAWRDAERAFEHPVIGTSTLPATFEASAERHAGRPAQRYKGGVHRRSMVPAAYPAAPDGGFAVLTYRELLDVVRLLATGFRELGVREDDRVGIFAGTRMEWAQVDLALLAAGAAVVTIYPRATEDRVRTILEDADAVGVVAGTPALVERVLDAGADVDWVVSMDELDGTVDGGGPGPGPAVHTLGAIHDGGAASYDADRYETWLAERSPSDLATLLSTSGTTGRPKGVPLTHRHLRSNVNQVWRRLGPRPDRDPSVPCIDHRTRLVSFLPLAHVFERLAGHFLMFAAGASVAYAEGPETLREDFAAVGPTIVTGVPRVYERLEASIREEAEATAVGAALYRRAVAAGRRSLEAEQPSPTTRLERAVLDRLVFRRIRAALGGEIELMISGGGRLSPTLCRRFHAMGLPLLEGYGLTETSPVVAVNPPEAPAIGTVGPPVLDCEVRLDTEVVRDDGGAGDSTGPVGELLVRGPNVVDGYWRRPASTARAFTPEGWFRTGDLFERREDGYLAFVERRKAMIVLSTGKNVAPGPIEAAIEADPLVEQCLVTGDGRRFVAALVVPNHEAVAAWAGRSGIDLPTEPSRRYRDGRVVDRFDRLVRDVNADLEPHETVKRFRLVDGSFTRENGLLTPTMKKRRRSIVARFEDAVAAMYDG